MMAPVVDEVIALVASRWWTCDVCGRKLGKIVENTVIIQPRPDRVITAPITSVGVTQTCKCGHNNTITGIR